MATKQIIVIEVTWSGWHKLRLNALIAWLASQGENLEIQRLVVREPKK